MIKYFQTNLIPSQAESRMYPGSRENKSPLANDSISAWSLGIGTSIGNTFLYFLFSSRHLLLAWPNVPVIKYSGSSGAVKTLAQRVLPSRMLNDFQPSDIRVPVLRSSRPEMLSIKDTLTSKYNLYYVSTYIK